MTLSMRSVQALLLSAVLALSTQAQPVAKSMRRLPDTGVTTKYSTTFGEDADYTFYPPGYVDHHDGTVTDTVTGLMWQQSDGGEMKIEAARIYADTCTLGGYVDWRLPDAHEAFSILNLDRLNPALDPVAFTTTSAQYWWTSELLVTDTTRVWVTNSGGGIGPHPRTETISAGGTKGFHVRVVRDMTPPPLVERFTDNLDGTVTDNLTGLMWQQHPPLDTLLWEEALQRASESVVAGYTDWRVPNIRELESINNMRRNAPSADASFLPGIVSNRYWSSTTQKGQAQNAWFNDFKNFGITSYDAKTRRYNVEFVRGPKGASVVRDAPLVRSLQVFPNPATMTLHLSGIGSAQGYCTITITSAAGATVSTGILDLSNDEAIMDASMLPNGTYDVRIWKDGKQIASARCVIVH